MVISCRAAHAFMVDGHLEYDDVENAALRETNKMNSVPNKAQCELISKIIKQVSMPKDVLANIIFHLAKSMVWTEETVAIITTCLQKKPPLDRDVIESVVNRIQRCVEGRDEYNEKKGKEAMQAISKGIKFSSFFHAFVTKYSNQIENTPFDSGAMRVCFRM